MAKENYSKYEMNGVLKVLPFSHVSLHKSNTKCTKLFFYHYKTKVSQVKIHKRDLT